MEEIINIKENIKTEHKLSVGVDLQVKPNCGGHVFSKDKMPFDIGFMGNDYIKKNAKIYSPKQLSIKTVPHGYANNFIYYHHYLKRKIYIARNVSYGLFVSDYCVGIAMYGYPVWREYPGLCPPNDVAECPELIRLCTLADLPKNTESYFLASTIKRMLKDWEMESGHRPICITSFCDLAFGFNGSIYRATNFDLYRITDGRPTNPGQPHGKWKKNNYKQKAKKAFYIYRYDSRKSI